MYFVQPGRLGCLNQEDSAALGTQVHIGRCLLSLTAPIRSPATEARSSVQVASDEHHDFTFSQPAYSLSCTYLGR